MDKGGVAEYFEDFLTQDSLFLNKRVLQNQFIPSQIFHRDEQLSSVAKILAPALRQEKPSNLFMYGKTGTGKTLTLRHVLEQMQSLAKDRDIKLKTIYLNCKFKKVADTEYRILAQLCREFGKEVPPTGLPTDEVYRIFFHALDSTPGVVILALDEIDQLIGKIGDEILYNLTRINTELTAAQLSIVGVSNDIMFSENLDPRVKSSLSEEELIFPPYNALQIQEILRIRAKDAFKEGVIGEGVLEKCAAYAARDHGDARRAIELLRVAGEIAERTGRKNISIKDLDGAEEMVDHDKFVGIVRTQPKQYQAALYAIMKTCTKRDEPVFTGEIYNSYAELCTRAGLRPLTQRRLSDVLAEFDMLGIINARLISKGRYGRTREITIAIPQNSQQEIASMLREGLEL